MHDPPGEIERLKKRLEALEQRVDALEHPLAARWPRHSAEPEGSLVATLLSSEVPQAGSLFPVLGKALFGIAGAYLLRAIEEANALPRLIVAVAGIAYAILWLVWASRVRSGRRIASAIYACTSALILAPMLWELTLRFKVLPAAAAAAVVSIFALGALALSWQRDLKPVLRVACIASAALALALATASHHFLPFVAGLLVVSAACELVPGCDRVPEARALIAAAADAAIWILIYIYFAGPSSGFPPLSRGVLLAPGIAIFILFAASVSVRTLLRAQEITAFETIQTIVAFLLAAVSVADFGQPAGLKILGVVCLVLSVGCFTAIFTVFSSDSRRRNVTVFAAWSAVLLLAGSFQCLPHWSLILLLGTIAPGAVWLGWHECRMLFGFYGIVFLLAASAASGLLNFLESALVGTPQGAPAAEVWLITTSAALCYLLARPTRDQNWATQALQLGLAVLAAGAVVALIVDLLVSLTALFVMPGAHHLALIRTVVLCAAALSLVAGGARLRRRELTWLGYGVLALLALKLVTEDLRHGHLSYIASSIFLVAFTLIAAPRAARARQKSLNI